MSIPSYVLHSLQSSMFTPSRGSTNYYFTYEDNKLFNKTLNVPVYKDNKTFFIPVIGLHSSLELLKKWVTKIKSNNTDTCDTGYIGIKLFYTNEYEVKTVNSALNWISKISESSRLCKLNIKGCIYYGGKGIILDSDWNPIMLGGFYASIHDGLLDIQKPVCYIAPEVFTNKDSLSKAIIKTIIPVFAQSEIFIDFDCFNSSSIVPPLLSRNSVLVIIQSLRHYVISPRRPIHLDNDDIWNFLNDNISDLTC